MTNFDVRRRVYEHAPRDISAGAFNVLTFLAHLANEYGVCWPKLDTLAWNTRMDERHVRRCLTWLEEQGQLVIHRRRGRGNAAVYGIATGLTARQLAALDQAVAQAAAALHRDAGKPDISCTNGDTKPGNLSAFPEKTGQIKPDIAIADFGSVMPNGDRINESAGSEIIDPPPPTPSTEGDAGALTPAAPAGGGGGDQLRPTGPGRAAAPPPAYPDTVTYLHEQKVTMAAAYGDIPLDVAKAAARATRNTTNGPGKLVGLLKRYRAGEWEPPAVAPPPVRQETGPDLTAEPPLTADQRRAMAARILGRPV